jgi:alkaline phosphatase D
LLGVASGDPAPDSVVLWTRLAPDPLHGGGLSDEPIIVSWMVAADEALQRQVRTGTAIAHPLLGHCVHVEVGGLEPDHFYFYRFMAGAAVSPVGRTRTLPAPGASVARWRLAFASCQDYQDGFYPAYRHLAEDAPDLVLHLGDYIYESPRKEGAVRMHESTAEPLTLDQYRNHYALYRTDPDLQQAHAAAPWAPVWDDHEIDNDWAGDRDQDGTDPQLFLLRRAAAFQAYYEHMPIRATALPRGPDLTLYQRFTIGLLAEINLLDTRQYRSDQACPTPEAGGGQVLVNCLERDRADRTILGAAQERWLAEGLSRSSARWQVLAQQVMMGQLEQQPGPERGYWSDGWDGYPAARSRLLELLSGRNAVVLSGDIHSFWANDLKADFNNPTASPLATEFVGTSISSNGVPYDRFDAFRAENPHIRFFESRYRGYGLCEITASSWRTTFRAVDHVLDRTAPARTLAEFVVEHGRPGVQMA